MKALFRSAQRRKPASLLYESSWKMEQALRLANRAMDEAERAKDTALTWIYVSEWVATTAVALMSGVALWWLMVMRNLYRGVAITRFRET